MSIRDEKITAGQLLLPLCLITFVVFVALAYIGTQAMMERQNLNQIKASQEQQVEMAGKVKAQLDALAVGTFKLSESGNKSAGIMIDRMKKAGLIGESTAQQAPAKPAEAAPKAE